MNNTLLLDKAEFLQALAFLSKTVKRARHREALLSFDGKELQIQITHLSAAVAASGVWRGRAAVSAGQLIGLGRRLNAAKRADELQAREIFVLKINERQLYLDNDVLPVLWHDGTGDLVFAPSDADVLDMLALRHKYSYEDLVRSNLLYHIEAAEIQRDRMLNRALQFLIPLGITRHELDEFVENSIRRRYGTDESTDVTI